jgi:hypothetical protein
LFRVTFARSSTDLEPAEKVGRKLRVPRVEDPPIAAPSLNAIAFTEPLLEENA